MEQAILYLVGDQLLLYPKKYGSWRINIDYKSMNNMSINNCYSFPQIDDMLNLLW